MGIPKPAAGMRCPPPSGCHEQCSDCAGQYLSVRAQDIEGILYDGQFSDDQAQAQLQAVLADIGKLRETLTMLLKSHGDLVLTRWTKKSKDKRKVILEACDIFAGAKAPGAPEGEEEQWMNFVGQVWSGARWVNTKHFAEDRMRLLTLLHVRSVYSSSEWALLDSRELFAGFSNETLAKKGHSKHFFNASCVWMCGDDYGSLVEYDEKLAHTSAMLGFPRAFMTFGVQRDICSFLVEIILNIIQESEPTGNSKWAALVASGFRGSGSETLWSSYISPAFAPPDSFDPKLLLQKAQSRLDLILDEIFLLQTDPTYMQYSLRCRKASIAYDETYGVRTELRWDELASGFMQETITRLNVWNLITVACKELCRNTDPKHEKGKLLSPEADHALDVLSSEIYGRVRITADVFNSLLPTLAPLKSRFTAYEGSNGTVQYRETSRQDTTAAPDRLAYCLSKIRSHLINALGIYGTSFAFEMLERELLAQSAAERVDKRMLDILSDIATADEMFSLCYHNQVGNFKINLEMGKLTPEERHERSANRYRKGALRINESTFRCAGAMMRRFYETPWPKGKKNLEWLEKATVSRRHLASFWKIFRDDVRKAEIASGMATERSAMSKICFDTEPAFLAELAEERKQCEEESAKALAHAANKVKPLAQHEPQSVWGSSSDDAPVRRKQTKAKAVRANVSSSGEESPRDTSEQSTSEEDVEPPDESPIFVKQDSIAVFSKMFPSEGSPAGTVRWPQFASAMLDAGFTATENGGSAVTFSGEAGSIVIHRPHPTPAYDPIRFQSIGRRLRRHFNWSKERFEVRKKEAA